MCCLGKRLYSSQLLVAVIVSNDHVWRVARGHGMRALHGARSRRCNRHQLLSWIGRNRA